ncbi:cytochrome C [Azohydromonas caseinilytica]|uniref:Cytochrome C n=1 Tax=Azohydromonas caseinilytica TaxID=2728836 RepID=A0A848F910_9BURK|nr:cytochrome C [Azohydromonas caseinilytica]NML15286.1 cytochrome C [Azohydromonas caseinilytica]
MLRTSLSLSSLAGAALLCALTATAPARAAVEDDQPGAGPSAAPPEALDERARRGLKLVPAGVHLNMKGRDRALVGLGSYLVNAAGACNDCHTHPSYLPGGDPFLGQTEVINAAQYLTGGRQFGTVTSANLRPDADGHPAGLKLWQFIRLMRNGRDPGDSHILQVMPWPVYGKMVLGDLRAIYEYLSALPPAADNPNPGP